MLLFSTTHSLSPHSFLSFFHFSVADILDADIVLVNFTVLCSEKYYSRIARLSGKSPQSFPSGKNGGRHFDSVYDS
ncbi:MAG: hypothetical protein ACI90V_011318, partial [Bacillariaceae sp.]